MAGIIFRGLLGGTAAVGGGGGPPYTATVTVPSGTVASNLTDFVVAVDLFDLPTAFWDAVADDGSDIRVTQSDGTTVIPFDVVRINTGAKTGWVFFKSSLLAASDNVFKIKAGYGDAALAVTDTNGRNAVWADYHRVFADGQADRTGNGTALALSGTPTGTWGITGMSLDLSTMHQGVCWDGTYYYTTDTDELVKWDASWTEVARNTTPLADTGISGVTHCGDLEALAGEIYVPVEVYPSGPYTNQHIAVFDASDLSFLRSYDISAEGREISSIAYNPADGLLYISDYTDGSSIMKYSTTGVYQGVLTLSSTITQIQGVTFFGGKLYVNADVNDSVTEVALDGTVGSVVYARNGTGQWEGLGHTDRGLLALYDSTIDVVYTLEPGWLDFVSGQHAVATGLTKFTQWTMGVSAVMTFKSGNHALLSYTENTSGDTTRATMARRSTAAFGIWNSTDLWATGSGDPVLGAHYRMVHTQDGTTSRKLYKNGALEATDTGCSQRPTGAGDTLFVCHEDASFSEGWPGSVNYVYLRNGVLSADWLAAEYASWETPSTFYAVT